MTNLGLKKSKSFIRAGFTIIELLVVIVVIGILATITIVSYGAITEKAVVENMKADLGGASTQLMRFYADNGDYPASVTDCPNTNSGMICAKISDGNTYDYFSDGQTYDLCVENVNLKYCITNVSSTPIAYVPPQGIVVTGGIETFDGSYTIRTFNSSGTLSITNGTLTGVSVLIVGGGANGATAAGDYAGSGGRGGQVLSLSNQTLTGNYSVTVGLSNQSSNFNSITATSGSGANGGLGATPDNGLLNGGNGTVGISSSITGIAKYYGGGGGGGGTWQAGVGGGGGNGGGANGGSNIYPTTGDDYGQDGGNGTTNSGGGGGGGGGGTDGGVGGFGGSGLVIVRYLTP